MDKQIYLCLCVSKVGRGGRRREWGERENEREYKMIVREKVKLFINDIAVCLETAARISK